jgi:hypothetical protein
LQGRCGFRVVDVCMGEDTQELIGLNRTASFSFCMTLYYRMSAKYTRTTSSTNRSASLIHTILLLVYSTRTYKLYITIY